MYQEAAGEIKRGRALADPPSPGEGIERTAWLDSHEAAARGVEQSTFQTPRRGISRSCARGGVDALRGLNISITTTAKTDEECKALLAGFRFPFKNRGSQWQKWL